MAFETIQNRSGATFISREPCVWDGIENAPVSSNISADIEQWTCDISGENIFGVVDSSLEPFSGYIFSGAGIWDDFSPWDAEITGYSDAPNISGEAEPFTGDFTTGALISGEPVPPECSMSAGASVQDDTEEWDALFKETISFANLTERRSALITNTWSTRWYGIPGWALEIDYGITTWFECFTGSFSGTSVQIVTVTGAFEEADGHMEAGALISGSFHLADSEISAGGNVDTSLYPFSGEILGCGGIAASFSLFNGDFFPGGNIHEDFQLWNGAFYNMADITASINQWYATIDGVYAFNSMYADISKFTAESFTGASVGGSATILDSAVFDVFFGQSLGVAAYFARIDAELYAGAIAEKMSTQSMTGNLSGTVTHVNRIYADTPLWEADIDSYIEGSGDVYDNLARFNSSISGIVINPATITDSFELFGFSGRSSQESSTELVAEFIRFYGIPVFVGRDTSPADIDCDFEEFTGDWSSGMSCSSVDTVAANIEYEDGVSF